MRRKALRTCLPLAAVALVAATAFELHAEGRIGGRVLNGTTKRPVANAKVLLLSPRGGMQQVGVATTDPEGRFAFSGAGIDPGSFYILQANHQDVPYHAPVRFEGSEANMDVEVFDATRAPAALGVKALAAAVHAEGQRVHVQEEIEVENASNPPRTYANADGTFALRLAPGSGEPTFAVIGLMDMQLPQPTEASAAPGEFKIRYPLKPGLTRIRVAYQGDYSQAQFGFKNQIPLPVERARLFVLPASLRVDSATFKPAGVDAVNDVQQLDAENLSKDFSLEATVSGEAVPGSRAENTDSESQVTTVSDATSKLGMPLFACFLLILLWALGVRLSKEWPRWREQQGMTPAQKQLGEKADGLLNSLADLDELFTAGKIPEKKYWRERLELKARLVSILKKSSPAILEAYAARRAQR